MTPPISLAYIVATNLEHPGLAIKFQGQLNGLSKHFKTQFVYFNYQNTDSLFIKLIHYIVFEFRVLLAFIFNHRIYFRYDPKAILTNIYCMFFSLFKPVYIEHNGIFDFSLKTLNRHSEKKLHHFIFFFYRYFSVTHIGVTKQIQAFLIEKGMKKTLYMQNGYEKSTEPESSSEAITAQLNHLKQGYKKIGIFVGNGYIWHGIDQIMSLFKDRTDCALVIVGKGYPSEQKKENICFLGPLSPGELKGVFEYCDFGLGAFNFQMNGLTQTSTLKTCEYLCYGLPVLVNIYDCASEFDALRPFVFNYYEDPCFFESILSQNFDKEVIRKHASACFNWETLFMCII